MTSALSTPTICVVVCTYTTARWELFCAAVRAAEDQLGDGDQLLVVVDHADDVLAAARSQGWEVVPNAHGRGLSGARNTGVETARCDAVAFLDDDAVPARGWLEALRGSLADPAVVGVAGAVEPAWVGGHAPRWFPREFGWVVGCDYTGLPGDGQRVRNPIGANMLLRRPALEASGGFSELVGRVGELPVGCEETELCIRLAERDPASIIVRATAALVHHTVPASRQTVGYFLSRCFHEGRSKAVLSGLVTASAPLETERRYATRILPAGVARGVAHALRGQPWGLARAAMVVLGLATTTFGYVSGRARSGRS